MSRHSSAHGPQRTAQSGTEGLTLEPDAWPRSLCAKAQVRLLVRMRRAVVPGFHGLRAFEMDDRGVLERLVDGVRTEYLPGPWVAEETVLAVPSRMQRRARCRKHDVECILVREDDQFGMIPG